MCRVGWVPPPREQVLAIFAKSKVEWPPGIHNLFQYLSFFNINIDITAPECLEPKLSYGFKWFAMQGMPIAAACVFVSLFLGRVLYTRIVKGHKKGLVDAAAGLVSTLITMTYFLYLLLVRNTFDIFNCNPTVPPDPRGIVYMEAAVVPCWVKGGLQMELFPWALVSVVVYVGGFPLFAMWQLWKHRELIKEDQLLRAMGFGNSKRDNPNCHFIR